MLKMSFYNNTLNKPKALEFVGNTSKPILYTHGYSWKNPTTYRKEIDKETAKEIITKNSLVDITEEETSLHINTFSANDLY